MHSIACERQGRLRWRNWRSEANQATLSQKISSSNIASNLPFFCVQLCNWRSFCEDFLSVASQALKLKAFQKKKLFRETHFFFRVHVIDSGARIANNFGFNVALNCAKKTRRNLQIYEDSSCKIALKYNLNWWEMLGREWNRFCLWTRSINQMQEQHIWEQRTSSL